MRAVRAAARSAIALGVALMLGSCGGGSPAPTTFVSIAYVDLSDAAGKTYFDGGTRIEIDAAYTGEFLTATLRHEMWHAMTGIVTHSPFEDCMSYSPAPDGLVACCPSERIQVLAARMMPMAFSFPEEPEALEDAIQWWNYSCGRIVAVLADE